MPTVLALGNRLVFHEVGWNLTKFLEYVEAYDTKADADSHWDEYQREIEPFEATDFFRPCYPEWLHDGIRSYYDAWWETDDDKKAQHILRANILIGAYEQWRVDSFFEVALDFTPGSLIKDLRTRDHDKLAQNLVGVRHAKRAALCVTSGRCSTGWQTHTPRSSPSSYSRGTLRSTVRRPARCASVPTSPPRCATAPTNTGSTSTTTRAASSPRSIVPAVSSGARGHATGGGSRTA